MEFSCDFEILQFALAREVEAYNFYMAMAEHVKSAEISKVFEDLAKEELEHKARLELEIVKIGRVVEREQPQLIPDHDYVVTNSNEKLDLDYVDVLALGIEKERAAFRTYVELIEHVNDKQSREVLLELAEEEVRHKLRFQNEYDALLKQG